MHKITVEEGKTNLTPDFHGRILKVGRKFVRITFPDMYKWWENGFEEMKKTDKGYAYKKDNNWYLMQ